MFASFGAPLDTAYGSMPRKKNNYKTINTDLKRKNQRSNKYFNEDNSLKSDDQVSIPIPMDYENVVHSRYQDVKPLQPNMNNNQELIEKVVKKMEEPKKEHFGTINMETFSTDSFDCQKMLAHVANCEKCRKFLMKKLKVSPQTQQDKEREDMLNLVIYAMTGIFILFLLDAFMSLGKMLRK